MYLADARILVNLEVTKHQLTEAVFLDALKGRYALEVQAPEEFRLDSVFRAFGSTLGLVQAQFRKPAEPGAQGLGVSQFQTPDHVERGQRARRRM